MDTCQTSILQSNRSSWEPILKGFHGKEDGYPALVCEATREIAECIRKVAQSVVPGDTERSRGCGCLCNTGIQTVSRAP
jgi:superfamily II DNA/RNA helicase